MPNFLQEETKFKYEYINASDCFECLTEQEKKLLVETKTNIVFEAGETIIKRGMLANNILYLTEGLVRVEFINDKKPFTVGLVQPHSFVGIVCCFAFDKFDFTAIAISKTVINFIPMDIIKTFITNNGEFALNLINHMSGVSNGIIHRITSLSQKNIEGALSLTLLDFAKIYKDNHFKLPVNRTELSKIVGYSKESVINTLSKFNKEKLINVSDRDIEIINPETLKQISRLG